VWQSHYLRGVVGKKKERGRYPFGHRWTPKHALGGAGRENLEKQGGRRHTRRRKILEQKNRGREVKIKALVG